MRLITFLLLTVIFCSCSTSKPVVETSDVTQSEIVIDDNTFPMETDLNTIDEQMEELDSEAAIAELTIDDTPPELESDSEISLESEDQVERFDHSSWDALLKLNVTDNGSVNYKGLSSNPRGLRDYISSLTKNMPDESWPKEDRLAYWINAYNAMTIDLILRNFPLNSIKDIKDPWKQRLWQLGDKWYNLDEIEHQILRKMDEPRIHFGIVCASVSCPKLLNEAFTAAKIEEQLNSLTREFLSDSNRNQLTADEIKISKIFQWFAKDFKQNGSLIDFLNTYSDVQISSNAKKRFLDYNWDLND